MRTDPFTTDLLEGSKYNPLFKNGWGAFNGNNPSEIYVNADPSLFTGPDWIMGLYTPTGGSAIAADPLKHNQLLAEAIPALSPPAGQQPILEIPERNYAMPILYAEEANWPRPFSTGLPPWLHSDIRDVAYAHTFKLFNEIVSISNQ